MIQAMQDFLINLFGNQLSIFAIAMVPVLELRAAIPIGISMGFDWVTVFLISVLGNMLPIPFIIAFLRPIFEWMKKTKLFAPIVHKLEGRAKKKADSIAGYLKWGLFIFVAVPLPGTGAWTGALIASFLDMRFKDCIFPIFMGVVTAGAVVTALSMGVLKMFF